MNKKLHLIVALQIIATITLIITTSYAWYTNYYIKSAPYDYKTGTVADYFAGGTGTKDDPYQINHARHLYNLAWLQDLGYFDDADSDTEGIQPYYFELTGNVDMSKLSITSGIQSAIPPIGIDAHPFVSRFNGNGYYIEKLLINTNFNNENYIRPDDTTLSKHTEDTIDSTTALNILTSDIGMFGSTGPNASTNKDEADIKDFYIDNSQVINSSIANAKMGIFAGYVNLSIANIGVHNSHLNPKSGVYTVGTQFSDYTLIGRYNEKEDGTGTEWTAKPGSGDGAGFGSSMNVKNIYDRLYKIYTNGPYTTKSYIANPYYDKTAAYPSYNARLLDVLSDGSLDSLKKNYKLPVVKATLTTDYSDFKENTGIELATVEWTNKNGGDLSGSNKCFIPISASLDGTEGDEFQYRPLENDSISGGTSAKKTSTTYFKAYENISDVNVGYLIGNDTKIQRNTNITLTDHNNFYKPGHDTSQQQLDARRIDLDDIPTEIKEALGTTSNGTYTFNQTCYTITNNNDIEQNDITKIYYGKVAKMYDDGTIHYDEAGFGTDIDGHKPFLAPQNCIWFRALKTGTATLVLTPDAGQNRSSFDISVLNRASTLSDGFGDLTSKWSEGKRVAQNVEMAGGYIYYYTFEIEAGKEYAIYNESKNRSQFLYLDIGNQSEIDSTTYKSSITGIDFVSASVYSAASKTFVEITEDNLSGVLFALKAATIADVDLYFNRKYSDKVVYYYQTPEGVVTITVTGTNAASSSDASDAYNKN